MDLNFKMRAYLMFNNIMYLINSYIVIHFMGQIKKKPKEQKKKQKKNKRVFLDKIRVEIYKLKHIS